MHDEWVAALAINLSLGLCFLCCLRLFSCCIKYSGALRELFDPNADISDQADLETSPYAATSFEIENIRRLRMLKDQQIAGSRRLWMPRSAYAYVTLLALVVDSCAFAAFSFTTVSDLNLAADDAAGRFTDIVRRIAKAFLLEFSDTSYSITFWVATGLAWFTVFIGIYLLIKDSRTNTLPGIIFQVFGMVLLFPICTTLMSVLSCRYSSNKDIRPILAVLPSLRCWEVEHTRMVVVGVITFIMFYIVDALLLARLIRSIIDPDDLAVKEGADAVYTDNGFTVSYFQAKVLISFVVSYWGIGSYSPWIVMVFIFIILVALTLFSMRTRPSNVDVLNSIRSYSFMFSLVVNICAILSMISHRIAKVSHLLVFAGVVTWMVLTLLHFCSQYGWLECRVFEPTDEGDISDSVAEAAAFYEPLGPSGQGGPNSPASTINSDQGGAYSPQAVIAANNGRGSPGGRTTTSYYHAARPKTILRSGMAVSSIAVSEGPVILDIPVPNFVTGAGTERYEAFYGGSSNAPQSSADQKEYATHEVAGSYEDLSGSDSFQSVTSFAESVGEYENAEDGGIESYVDISSGLVREASNVSVRNSSSAEGDEQPANRSNPTTRRRGGAKKIVYVNLSSNNNDSVVLL